MLSISLSRSVVFAAVIFAEIGIRQAARADLITVGQLGTINVAPGTQSDYVTIPVFDAGGSAAQMTAWRIALRVVPLGGATGTVTVDIPSRAYASGHVLTDAFPASAPDAFSNSPTAGDVAFESSTADFITPYPVNSSGQSLMQLKFNASGLASGAFDVRLVEVNEHTYWTDDSFTNRAFRVNGTPLTLQTPGSLSLGTIQISAVPEPSSLLLTGFVVGSAAWRNRRVLRRRA